MDGATLSRFQEKLEQKRNELAGEAARKADSGRNATPDGVLDPIDRAESNYEKEILFSESENETEMLRMVESALDRVQEGNYGECLSCGRKIGIERLEAVPWTHYCISCQRRMEGERSSQPAA